MARSTEGIIHWASTEFGIKITEKDVANLLTSKNGSLYTKLFGFFTQNVKSSNNGRQLKEAVECVMMEDKLSDLRQKIGHLEQDVQSLLDSYAVTSIKKHKDNLASKALLQREYFLGALSDVIHEIATLRDEPTQTVSADVAIDDFSNISAVEVSETLLSPKKSQVVVQDRDLSDQIGIINLLVQSINETLYNIASVEFVDNTETFVNCNDQNFTKLTAHACVNSKSLDKVSDSEVSNMIAEIQALNKQYVETRDEALEILKEKINTAIKMIENAVPKK